MAPPTLARLSHRARTVHADADADADADAETDVRNFERTYAWRQRGGFVVSIRVGVFGTMELPSGLESILNSRRRPPHDGLDTIFTLQVEGVGHEPSRIALAGLFTSLMQGALDLTIGPFAFEPSTSIDKHNACSPPESKHIVVWWTQTPEQRKVFNVKRPFSIRKLLDRALEHNEDRGFIKLKTDTGADWYRVEGEHPVLQRDSDVEGTYYFNRVNAQPNVSPFEAAPAPAPASAR